MKFHYTLTGKILAVVSLSIGIIYPAPSIANDISSPVQACVIPGYLPLNHSTRHKIAQCLGWQSNRSTPLCHGFYQSLMTPPLENDDAIHVNADEASLFSEGRSELRGHVEVSQAQQMVSADTAYIYRDKNSNQVTKIVLLDEVRYIEPDRLMIARKATLNPQDKSGHIEDVIYRFNTRRVEAILPAWGRASYVERLSNKNLLLKKTTYTTCAPNHKAWQIEADEIQLDNIKEQGIARHALLRVGDWPLLYTPYLSFPTTKKRKSGFLMPMAGYSNVGGFDLALPYYWNIAPNYDATIVPHLYAIRGLMMGGDFRFLTNHSTGTIGGSFLPSDSAFKKFLIDNQDEYPQLKNTSNDRWSVSLHDNTAFSNHLHLNINYQDVSDNYYLQDFSSNLAIITENQLLQLGQLTYTTDHWLFSGLVQNYQTLHPINQTPVVDAYQRLPQLLANGSYNDLPWNANLDLLGQFDYYQWPVNSASIPQGPRFHANPVLSIPTVKSWGYITPSVEFVENYYDVHYDQELISHSFNRTIPRYSLDGGLTFERLTSFLRKGYTQTLEPRLYYLYVPFQNQTPIPVYDSGYMIFNTDQLFRNNRFSGYDRIGDTNQLAYAVTSRWLSEDSGQEKASVSVGQIQYFANRQVQLCYDPVGNCQDNPLTLAYVSPTASSSPIASRGTYNISPAWVLTGDYVWDPATSATNNGDLNFHYQPAMNHIVSVGYSYLVNGNLLQIANSPVQDNALHQAALAYSWPFSEHWSGLGAYSYNVSKHYDMMTFLGVQYDNCCWAMRLMGGRTFQSLSPNSFSPEYNNNVYLQILLKGLGSVSSSNPMSILRSYFPGYRNMF